MRTNLTYQQSEILDSNKKSINWLFHIDIDNDGIYEYFWSTSDVTVLETDYDFKIKDFTPLTLQMPEAIESDFPENRITIQCSMKDSNIDNHYASDFEGKIILVKLVMSADLTLTDDPGDSEDYESDEEIDTDIQETEILSWKFIVGSASCVDQVLTLECKDFFSYYLEGDYPNTPLISELFPNSIMKEDNICVPILFGNPYIPLRWCVVNLDAIYRTPTQFYIEDTDLTDLFTTGTFIICNCGVDGYKYCYVTNSLYDTGDTYVNLSEGLITSNLSGISVDNYLLGYSGKTYNISEVRSPQEFAGKSIYSSYTIKKYDIVGSDLDTYTMSQILIDDSDDDDVNDANGFWGTHGKEIYDAPFLISSSDLVNTKNPVDIISYIIQDFGLSSNDIDTDSATTAATTLSNRGILLNCGLHYRQSRKDILGKLSYISGMIPVYRDKIYFKVLTKEPQLDIEEYLIKPHSFSSSSQSTFTEKNKDSGYILWQDAGLPQDKVNKSVISAKTSYVNRSDTTLECEWLPSEEIALKSGILSLQRSLLIDKTVNFTTQAKILKLEPGDFIRLKNQNQGVENNNYYSALITKMTITKDLWIDVECTTFSNYIDDWDDVSISVTGTNTIDTSRGYSGVYQGPVDNGDALEKPNSITSNVLIGENGKLKTNNNPSSNGGFIATNSAIRCYNTDGNIRFEAIYSGAEQGNVTIGNYAGGQGLKWDQGLGNLNIISDSTNAIHISAGGDITLEGNDTNPSNINLVGTDNSVQIGLNTSGSYFIFKSSDPENQVLSFGSDGTWNWADDFFAEINMYATYDTIFYNGDYTGGDGTYFRLSGGAKTVEMYVATGSDIYSL